MVSAVHLSSGMNQNSRTQKWPDDVSKEMVGENVDEILVVVPEVTGTKFWYAAARPSEQLTHQIASPFGDW